MSRAGSGGVARDAFAAISTPLGINHLFVRVRGRRGVRDFDHVRFIRARRMPSLLARRSPGRVVGVGNVRITFSVARRTATVPPR